MVTAVPSSSSTLAVIAAIYNLSRRTALYATASQIDNAGNFARSVDGLYAVSPTTVTAGGKSQGVEAGIRHIF